MNLLGGVVYSNTFMISIYNTLKAKVQLLTGNVMYSVHFKYIAKATYTQNIISPSCKTSK